MPKRAYSYIRFSKAEQSKGDSFRRQLEATRLYCEKNDLILDETLNLKDLGISAFKGRNAISGSLARFIDLAERGQIPADSALVVESLDRISRQKPRRTVALLNQLLDLGIELHLTMANKVFRPSKVGDSGSEEGIDLILAVAWAMRAHEESELKSKRLRITFAEKRSRAAKGQALVSKTLPWWLILQDDKIVVVPERSLVVKRIFKLTASGFSSGKIARLLNSEGIPTWRPRAHEWQDSRIRDLIRNDTALGHLLPTPKTRAAGGESATYRIENYYPRIVSDALAVEARAKMKDNTVQDRGVVAKAGRPINLFRGILRHRGRWCRNQSHRNGTLDPVTGIKGWNNYYDDHDTNNEGKKSWCIAARQLEPVIIHGLRELSVEDLLPNQTDSQKQRSLSLRRQIQGMEVKIANLVSAIEDGSPALAARLRQIENEVALKRRALVEAEVEEGFRAPLVGSLRAISVDLTNPEIRCQTALAIRRIVKRIDVAENCRDLHLGDELIGRILRKMIVEKDGMLTQGEEYTHSFEDPVPNNKRRKPLYILVTFRSGARRLLARDCILTNQIITLRLEG